MNQRHKRAVQNTLRLLESQVGDLVAEKQEDAGAVALRAIVDPENQDAEADRDRAKALASEAHGCLEVLELIQAAMQTVHGGYQASARPAP
ncbi:MAG: hypothetical protein WC815_24110 [Vicinamibacterales bacterium]|jgi:hypothetical protein